MAEIKKKFKDNENAQNRALGKLYEEGLGVPQNFQLAHMYYNLAGAQGSTEARQARDSLATKMSPELVAIAQDKAAAWRPASADRRAWCPPTR